MAKDKAVDSTQLNTDLTSVANAIRTKGGTQAQLAFPAGFVSAIQAIPTGGGGLDFSDLTDISYLFYNRSELLDGADTIDWSSVTSAEYAFNGAITDATKNTLFQSKVSGVNLLGGYMFARNEYLTDIDYDDENISLSAADGIFQRCFRLPLDKAIEIVAAALENNLSTEFTMSNTFSMCAYTLSPANARGFKGKISAFSYTFQYANFLKLGLIESTATNVRLTNMFANAVSMDEIEGIKVATLSNTASHHTGMIQSVSPRKFGGITITNTSSQSNIPFASSGYLMPVTNNLEEILNMPISFFGYGAKNIGPLNGSSGARKPLKRLTFNTTNIAYKNKTNAKSFSIAYCNFDRDGMVEMFNSLPDASDVTGAKVITITGNPCVTGGTLTAADRAIATNKGYSLTE